MKRTQVYLTNNQHAQIAILAKEQGVSFSEMLRRILNEFFTKHHKRGINVKALKKYAGFIKLKEKTNAVKVINEYYENAVV